MNKKAYKMRTPHKRWLKMDTEKLINTFAELEARQKSFEYIQYYLDLDSNMILFVHIKLIFSIFLSKNCFINMYVELYLIIICKTWQE